MKKVTLKALVQTVKRFQECFYLTAYHKKERKGKQKDTKFFEDNTKSAFYFKCKAKTRPECIIF